jgi:hypothetical protein
VNTTCGYPDGAPVSRLTQNRERHL